MKMSIYMGGSPGQRVGSQGPPNPHIVWTPAWACCWRSCSLETRQNGWSCSEGNRLKQLQGSPERLLLFSWSNVRRRAFSLPGLETRVHPVQLRLFAAKHETTSMVQIRTEPHFPGAAYLRTSCEGTTKTGDFYSGCSGLVFLLAERLLFLAGDLHDHQLSLLSSLAGDNIIWQ